MSIPLTWRAPGISVARRRGRAVPCADVGADLNDAGVAELYDAMFAWDPAAGPAAGFWSKLVMDAPSVLDVGCGTGVMLHAARDAGHRGRLVGIDPDPEMLARARVRTDVEWVAGQAADCRWEREFALATMVSHGFQCLITDDEVRGSLVAIGRSLVDGGRFAFETRHPAARAWEAWGAGEPSEVEFHGRMLSVSYEIDDVAGDVVTLTEVTAIGARVLRRDQAELRFLDLPTLNGFLAEAGFEIEAQYGWWDRSPVNEDSEEIITIARRV
jgi:SAM-dependent methyltransferase